MKPVPVSSTRGFTLIELMIVVAVVAILGAVAYPSYRDSVLKGQRAEARAALAELLQQQERFMTQQNTYQAFAAGTSGVPFKTYVGNNAAGSKHLLGAEACPDSTIALCVRVFAEPTADGADPVAGTLQLTSTGVKTCTGSDSSRCWR